MLPSDAKRLTLIECRGTIINYRKLLDDLEKDINSGDENLQSGAAICLKALRAFMVEPSGFKAWADAVKSAIDEQIKLRRGMN